MKLKKLVALLLAGSMAAALLAGCGKSEEDVVGGTETADNDAAGDDADANADDADDADAAGDDADADADADDADDADDEDEYDEEDLTEIKMYAMTLFGEDGLQEVEDAINAISEPKAGVHVDITLMDMAAYAEQTSLMFSGQEQMDIMMTTPIQSAGFSSLVAQNQLTPLNDLLPEEAPELYEMMQPYLEGTTVDGNIYSVTNYRLLNSNCYALMRADILDSLGLREKAENCKSWTEYQEILQAVKDSGYDGGKVTTCLANNDNDGTVITVEYAMVGNDNWEDNFGYDTLGDTYKIIAVDEATDTVYSYFESEEYYKMLKLMTDMYAKGFVYQDAATSDEGGDPLIKNNVTFGTVVNSETGVEANRLSTTGYEVVAPMITQEPLSTGSVTKFSWAIPTTAKEPEAAARFLNLMYTNADIENLLAWGIEGRDYELNENGEAVKLEGCLYNSADFLWGNQFLAHPAAGQGGVFREKAEAELKAAPVSKYFGCTVNTDPISNDLTAVYNVIQQYKAGYESGSVAVPDTYEEYKNGEFCKALQDAGVEKVLAEYQSQLDAWLANQQ